VDIVLLRHADAAGPAGPDWSAASAVADDATRPLTAVGRHQAHAIAQRLRWYDCGVDQVWVSPLLRTLETAEIVMAIHNEDAAVHVDERLRPNASAQELQELLAIWLAQPNCPRLIVAHQPTLQALARGLLGDGALAPIARAEAMRITNGRLRWRFRHGDDAPRR
jgi:phosphohistidine phosphatase SixA